MYLYSLYTYALSIPHLFLAFTNGLRGERPKLLPLLNQGVTLCTADLNPLQLAQRGFENQPNTRKDSTP